MLNRVLGCLNVVGKFAVDADLLTLAVSAVRRWELLPNFHLPRC
jgi:hypothetical protein